MIKPILGRASNSHQEDFLMPTKSSKAASRQSKLSRKKRRDKPGPQQIDTGPIVSEPSDEEANTAVAEAPVEVEATQAQAVAVAEATPEPETTPRPASRQRAARRPGRRATDAGDSQVYKYLGGELRQIGIITVIVAAILVALTFVLG